jgi:hypothetical protein
VSVALPENETTSPTLQVSVAAGARIVADGGVFPGVIVIGALIDEAPSLSVTLRRTA